MAVVVDIEIRRRAGNRPPRKFGADDLTEIGGVLLEGQVSRAASGKSATGDPFAPLDPEYAAAKAASGARPILFRTGALARSMRVKVGKSSVEVGPEVTYARFLHYGTRHMPARPLVGYDPELLAEAKILVSEIWRRNLLDRRPPKGSTAVSAAGADEAIEGAEGASAVQAGGPEVALASGSGGTAL